MTASSSCASAISVDFDRTQSDLYPRFIQTEGADITNAANYRPTANGLNNRDDGSIQVIRQPKATPAMICLWPCRSSSRAGCTGASRRLRDGPRPAAGIMSAPVRWASEPTIQTMEMVMTGRRVPLWQADTYIKNGEPVTPALWTEDFIIAPPPLHGQQPGGRGSQRRLYHGARTDGPRRFPSAHRISRAFASRKPENEGFGWVRARIPSNSRPATGRSCWLSSE